MQIVKKYRNLIHSSWMFGRKGESTSPGLCDGSAPNGYQAISWPNDNPVH